MTDNLSRKRRVLMGAAGVVAVIALAGSVAAFKPRASALVMTPRAGDDTLVINQANGSRLDVIVLDQYGRTLRTDTTARYERIGGDSIAVSADGRLSCARRSDDVVVR